MTDHDLRSPKAGACRRLVGVVVLSWAAAGIPVASEGVEVSVPVDTSGLTVATGPSGDAVFTCSEVQWLGQTGEPQLPWRVMTVLLPPDADLGTVTVRLADAGRKTLEGRWTVAPVPPIATWEGERQRVVWPENKTLVGGRDMAIYGRDAFWPEMDVRLLDTGSLRKYRLAQVAVPLLRVNPVTGVLEQLSAGDVVVSFNPTASLVRSVSGQANSSDSLGEDTIRRIVSNFQQQAAAYAPADATDDTEAGGGASGGSSRPGYVIITTSAIQSASARLADFVAHKTLCGFNAWIVTEADFGGGVGNVAAENIRAWLQQHYVTDRIQYVLLIGNPHPSDGDVPMKMLWPRFNQAEDREAPSDYYYADLTGNWDRDGDGYYGEWSGDFGSGGVDRYWEVLVGRIPYYGSIDDLDWILAKLIRYGLQPSGDLTWRKNVLLPMKPSDESTPGYHLGQQIKNSILVPAGWASHRVYEETYGLVPPPETTPCTVANVTSVWTGGAFGLVVWWTHGSSFSAEGVMNSIVATSLNDVYPTFTFQVSCNNSQPEGVNLSTVLLRYAAACTVGATRVSWYYVGQTQFSGSPSNAGMGYEYASRVVGAGLTSGQALHELKQVLSPTSASMWMNFVVFNIYGDPAMGIVPNDYAMTLDVVNEPWGQVQVIPEPNDANAPRYPAGTVVSLTATPIDGKAFRWWEIYDPNHPGDANYAVVDSNISTQVVMDRPREVTATFKCGSGSGVVPAMAVALLSCLYWMRCRESVIYREQAILSHRRRARDGGGGSSA